MRDDDIDDRCCCCCTRSLMIESRHRICAQCSSGSACLLQRFLAALSLCLCCCLRVSVCVCVFVSTGYLWPLALSARLQFDAVAFHFGHKCALRRTTLAVNANRFLVLCCTGIARVDVVAHVAANIQSDIEFILEPQNCSPTPSS